MGCCGVLQEFEAVAASDGTAVLVQGDLEAPRLCSLFRAMPNGDRESYRVGPAPPSPSHTSDSESTHRHKRRYWHLVLWVVRRWVSAVFFAKRRAARWQISLAMHTALGAGCRGVVLRTILSFLVLPSQVTFCGLPAVNRFGVLGPPTALGPSCSSSDVSMEDSGADESD